MIEDLIESVWALAKVEDGYNPDIWRKDFAGAWIRKDQLGQRTDFGWMIDHKIPRAYGGNDSLENLQVIHWKNNLCKGADYETFTTVISSDGNKNVKKIRLWHLNIER